MSVQPEENGAIVKWAPNEIREGDFEEQVLQAERPVLVAFLADWSGPCRMMGPALDQLTKEQDKIKVYTVNADEATDLALEYDVLNIPAFYVFIGGQVKRKFAGTRALEIIKAEELAEWL